MTLERSLENLRWLREDFSDEIPDEVLHGKGGFKVRRNWWQGIVGELGFLRLRGHIPPELEGEVEEFLSHYASDNFRYRQPLTTKEDIFRANGLIDKMFNTPWV